MAETFKYQLVFDTVLNPEGGNAALRTIDSVDAAASRATRISSTSGEALSRVMSDNAAKAKVSEIAYYDLDAAMRRTNATSQSFSTGQTRVQQSTRNSSAALLMFSQGFEDAQYGIRGVMNNIPGLVMALGGSMGIAGAVSLAAVGISILVDLFGKTEKAAESAEEKTKEFAEGFAEVRTTGIDQMVMGLWDVWEAAEATRQVWDDTKKASDSYATSALANADKIRQAELLIAEALGQQVNLFEILDKRAEAEAAKRRLASENAIREQQEIVVAAEQEFTVARAKIATAEEARAKASAQLEIDRERLKVIVAQKAALEKAAQEANILSPGPGAALGGSLGPTEEAKQAQNELDFRDFEGEIEGLKLSIERLGERVGDKGGELNRKVVAMTNAAEAARVDLEDKQAAAAIKIGELQSTLAADTTLAEAQLAVDQGKALAEALQATFGEIKTGNAQQQAAQKELLQATSDGKITADEVAQLSRNVSNLIGGLQVGFNSTNQNFTKLMATVLTQQDKLNAFELSLKVLNSKVR